VNGKCEVDAFIELPEEIREIGKCAKLDYWLYGMRPAARAWEDTYADKLIKYGFVQGGECAHGFLPPGKEFGMRRPRRRLYYFGF